MAILSIYRSGTILANVNIGKDTVYKGVVMASDKITAKFSSPTPISFQRGDYIQHNGQTYRLDRVPELLKWSSNGFSYSAEFEGLSYRLYDRLMRHLGSLVFSYYGTPETFLQLIIDNINEIDPGWTIGTVESITEGKILEFSGTSCREALTSVAKAFNLEFSFDGKEISLVNSVGLVISGLAVSYGKGNGLYSLNRKNTESRVITRFIGIGGSKNLPEGYRGGLNNLSFDVGYVERNVLTHGVIESLVEFENIYPRRIAAITSAPNPTEIIDTTIDFNLNDYLIEGQSKIVFTTGDLGGNEFDIISYDHATKKIKFKTNKEDTGYELPNTTVKAEIGDLYTLVGIPMPTSYVTAAEAELQAAINDHADANQYQLNAYDLNIDEKFIRDNLWTGLIRPGDRIHTEDVDMNLDATLRIQELSYPICNPSQITATLSDQVIYTVAEKIVKAQIEARKNIEVIKKTVGENARINSIRREELRGKIFDPDDYFDTTNIKPQSIEALHLSIGSRTQDFSLSVVFKPNFAADPNVMQWTSGVITHFTIDSSSISVWDVDTGSISALTSGQAYYIYVKALRVGTTATIVVETAQRKVDSDATYYYFLVGVLSSVIGGVRVPTFTYGFSELNGRFLTTGRIQSSDALTYLDLDTGAAAGTFTFRAGSSGYNNITDKPDLSGFALTSALKAMAYEDIVNIAKLDSTIIVGGMLKNTLIDAVYVKANIVNAAYVQTLDLVANKITSGKLQSVNTLNYFDLTNNQFKVGNATNYMDWNVTTPNVLTIKGHITADSGTISGVTINANDQFSLNGSKVEIFPNAGIRVFGAGYADFTNATLKVPTVAASGLASGEAALWIGSLSGVASGASGGSVATLSDVALTSLATGQILVWNGSTWVNQNNVAAVDLSAYYTKTETQNFFSGASAMSGYNKSNWDSAYAASHSHANKAFLDGITSGATVGINISGSAANATQWNGNSYFGPLTGSISLFMISTGTGFGTMTLSQVQSGLGLGSAAYTASSAYYAAGSTVANSTQWGGQTYNGSVAATIQYALVYDNTNAQFRLATASNLQSFLGLGSNAYSSTAYLPLSGGTLSGALYATALYDNGSRVLSQRGNSYYQVDTWLQLNGSFGLYAPTSGAGSHWHPNGSSSTYGSWVIQGSKNGYSGIYDNHSGVNMVMYDIAGNGGAYRESTGLWYYYYNASNNCFSLGGTTSTSGYKLQVNGQTRSTGLIYCDTTIESAGYFYSNYGMYNPSNGLYFGQPIGNAGWYLKSNHTNVQVQLRTSDDNVRGYVYADTGNNIGFLHNGGGWSIQCWNGGIQAYHAFYSYGDIVAFSSSDKYLKNNIRPVINALDKVNQLSGNYFEWNGLQDTYEVGKTDIGVIAQEVEAVLPELVTTRDNGFKAVKYEKLVPVLIEAIKELTQRLEVAERRLA